MYIKLYWIYILVLILLPVNNFKQQLNFYVWCNDFFYFYFFSKSY